MFTKQYPASSAQLPCPRFGVLINEDVDAGDDGKENDDDDDDESRGVTRDDRDRL